MQRLALCANLVSQPCLQANSYRNGRRMVGETLDAEPSAVTKRPVASIPIALLRGMRPKQWSKNLFLFVALLFTGNIPTSFSQSAKWLNLGLAAVAFLI